MTLHEYFSPKNISLSGFDNHNGKKFAFKYYIGGPRESGKKMAKKKTTKKKAKKTTRKKK